jgi:hypothetical protein
LKEWLVPFTDELALASLQRLLDEVEGELSSKHPGAFRIAERIARLGGLTIEVFAREHPPPHFRVKYNGETANFRISDGEQLNGGLERYRRVIADWWRANKELLIQAWDSRRPSDCPVGVYRET